MASNRNIKDADLSVTTALPAAAANNSSAAIDLGSVTLGAAAESVEYKIDVPILPALIDDKTVIFTLTDSATVGGSYVAISGTGSFTVTGTETPGTPAALEFFGKLPVSTRQFIKLKQTVLTGAGVNTGESTDFSIRH